MSNFAEDYIPVNERIAAFYAKHPDGSLQSEVIELSDTRVTIRGLAYRSPEDPRPGIGLSSLEIPGKTPYTRGSEVENCETSAWGRAIAALGFEVKRGIASAEEVRSKTDHSPASAGRAVPPPVRPAARPDPYTSAPPRFDDVPDEPPDLFADAPVPFAPIGRPENAVPTDECPIHHEKWRGDPGDRYHGPKGVVDGGYCRHPDNVKRSARRAS